MIGRARWIGLAVLMGLLLLLVASADAAERRALPEETPAAFVELLRASVEAIQGEPLSLEQEERFEKEIEPAFEQETESYAAYEEELVITGEIGGVSEPTEQGTETQQIPAEEGAEAETEAEPEWEPEPEIEMEETGYEDSSETAGEEEAAVNDELLYEPPEEGEGNS